MKLYGVPLSVHTRKVQIALRAKGLECDLAVVIPILPETLPENWANLSPTGLIPVLEDGAFCLPDSAAILQYLDAKYPAHPMIPADPRNRGQALWLEAYLGGFFRDAVHPLFHQKTVAPMQGGTPDAAVVDRVLAKVIPKYLAYLDGIATGECIVGSSFSVADIAVGANLVQFHYLGGSAVVDHYPALARYFERLVRQPVFVEQLAAEEPFAANMGLSQSGLRD
ncbi:MAG: glutathione S-transferase family protein [Nitrospiraceae bacterium]|nr:glutathione S-transferase family protein [Nitrospiraceae bacterium]